MSQVFRRLDCTSLCVSTPNENRQGRFGRLVGTLLSCQGIADTRGAARRGSLCFDGQINMFIYHPSWQKEEAYRVLDERLHVRAELQTERRHLGSDRTSAQKQARYI